jgi:hypothetical protein
VSQFRKPEGENNESDPDPEKGASPRNESLSPDKSTSEKKRQSVDDSDTDDSPAEEAPNISLNVHGWSDVSELALYAFLGIVLQVGVLVFSGFVAYDPRLNAKLGGPRVSAGFPLQAVGTIFLLLSMFLCSLVIDQSTKERMWVVKGRDEVMLTKNVTSPNPRAGSNDGEAPTAKSKEMMPTEIATSPNSRAGSTDSRASSTSGEKLVRIFWLQKRHVAGDQSFDSYLLMPKQKRDEILTSRRSISVKADNAHQTSTPQDGKQNVGGIANEAPKKSMAKKGKQNGIANADDKVVEGGRENFLSVVTVFGILSGIFGFVAQFEGFRLSNWSSAIAQLVAVFFMTILRAVVRRGLIEGPANEKLPDQYEMDWLALQLATSPKFLNNFGDPPYPNHSVPLWRITLQEPEHKGRGKGHRAVKIRQRLGQLTKWVGPASKEAITIANAIEIVMNKLEPSEPQPSHFKWSVNVSVDKDKGTESENGGPGSGNGGTESQKEVELVENIDFTVTWERGEKMWRADATEIEAALSLWNYYFWKQYNKLKILQRESNHHDWLRPAESRLARPCHRVLGQNTDALSQDVAWWIGDGIAQETRVEYDKQSAEDILWWGFNDKDSRSDSDSGSTDSGKSSKLLPFLPDESLSPGGFGRELECFHICTG